MTDRGPQVVVWKITPLFADWIASPSNVLFKDAVLDSSSTVIELGCGISGIVGLALAPRVGTYLATEYVFTSGHPLRQWCIHRESDLVAIYYLLPSCLSFLPEILQRYPVLLVDDVMLA